MWTFHCFGKLSVERMVGVKFGRLQVVWSGVFWWGQQVSQGIAMCKIWHDVPGFGKRREQITVGGQSIICGNALWQHSML